MPFTIEQSLEEIDLSALTANRAYYPSPAAWEDEVLYFLLVDRFSDGQEFGGFLDNSNNPVGAAGRSTPLFSLADAANIDRSHWFENGKKWCGGNLRGLKDKLGYLKRLGVTSVWLSPVFRQTTGSTSYHGYGIQNFLDIDKNFGTRQELKELVEEAHAMNIRVILDIILNHAGDVFAYKFGQPYGYFNGIQWEVDGYKKDADDHAGSLPFGEIDLAANPDAWPSAAIWPKEFQSPENWTRKGKIKRNQWDEYPTYLEGDFETLKDINLGFNKERIPEWDLLKRIAVFEKSKALTYLAEVYKFWIAFADIDGFRIDTVKHMDPGAVRYFTNVIHEFAQCIGKENFYLIGEITGGRQRAVNIVDSTGLDAGLGIDDIQDKLEFLAKGARTPYFKESEKGIGYFNLFNNSLVDGKNSHQWFAKRVVTMFDDHDQVGAKHKFRFCGQPDAYGSLKLALAINLATMGIPCLYYGTEQAFNGADQRFELDEPDYSDIVLRECMFGGEFGSLQSRGKHFFNEAHEIYQFTSSLALLRQQRITLRRGRQYPREISETGNEHEFFYPSMINNNLQWLVAWSRIFNSEELVCVINTDLHQAITGWITVDADLCRPGAKLECIFSTDPMQHGLLVTVDFIAKRSAVKVTVPPGGVAIFCN